MRHDKAMDQSTINEARIIDAVSWLVKAAAQLRIVGLDTVAIDRAAKNLYAQRKVLATQPTVEPADGHDAMVEHAILNAYGHALYSGHDCCSEIETICDRIMKGIS